MLNAKKITLRVSASPTIALTLGLRFAQTDITEKVKIDEMKITLPQDETSTCKFYENCEKRRKFIIWSDFVDSLMNLSKKL